MKVCGRVRTSVEVVAGEQTGWRVDAGHGVLDLRVADLQGQHPRGREGERERSGPTSKLSL